MTKCLCTRAVSSPNSRRLVEEWDTCSQKAGSQKPRHMASPLLQEIRLVRKSQDIARCWVLFQWEWSLHPEFVLVAPHPEWSFSTPTIQGGGFSLLLVLWDLLYLLVLHLQLLSKIHINLVGDDMRVHDYMSHVVPWPSRNYLENWSEYLRLYWNKWEEKVVASSWYLPHFSGILKYKKYIKVSKLLLWYIISCELLKDKDEVKCTLCQGKIQQVLINI